MYDHAKDHTFFNVRSLLRRYLMNTAVNSLILVIPIYNVNHLIKTWRIKNYELCKETME